MAPGLTGKEDPGPVEVAVLGAADVLRAAQASTAFAAVLGFPAAHCDEIGLVVMELASNLVRHASGGSIRVGQMVNGPQGIEIRSVDNGPGIADIDQAITDGYSTAGGPGLGLGTVNRLMDELQISSGLSGLEVLCRRWVRPQASSTISATVAFGAATRSYRCLAENGDAFLFKQWGHFAILGVIDGLGHGQHAQRAAQTARYYVEQHFDQPLHKLFCGVDRACRATRGVVMALARLDLERAKLTVASVGNVGTRLFGGTAKFDPVIRRGILGSKAPDPELTEHPWTSASILVMHSDGVRCHWDWNQFPDLADKQPQAIAESLMAALGQIEDDATVIVARSLA